MKNIDVVMCVVLYRLSDRQSETADYWEILSQSVWVDFKVTDSESYFSPLIDSSHVAKKILQKNCVVYLIVYLMWFSGDVI